MKQKMTKLGHSHLMTRISTLSNFSSRSSVVQGMKLPINKSEIGIN